MNKPLIKQVLLRAADIAATLDHHKGDLFKYAPTIDGGHIVGCCALGAIEMADHEVRKEDSNYDTCMVFRSHLEDAHYKNPVYEDFGDIGEWNDQPHIGKAEVVKELKACADAL